jgi:hypothetical protein
MAKGLRSSVKKSNRTKLRARVFGPVVDARTERLSAKLLELAQQPKPARPDMEVDSEKGTYDPIVASLLNSTNILAEATSEQQPAAEEAIQQAEGTSFGISCPIPVSLSDSEGDWEGEQQPKDVEEEENATFYQLLGLSADVIGFGTQGELLMRFDS